MTANLIVAVLFAVAALPLLVLGYLATTGKLKGNSYVGLRVQEVRQEEAIWTQAHRVTGPFLILAGVTLAFGAAFAWIAAGWLWLAPVVAVVLALVFLSVGGNMGARTASLLDAAQQAEQEQPAPQPEAPAVDLDALRRAAGQSDKPGK
ncbi:SdpI family protein [Corynebacterium cystitidis]|uniref:SdpI family protein n=1 Tax=Corynebacterium cystitidis TaxID=35757 RepID=UPI00211DEFAB|nr:SdpI family protein [Corynebacterium cystitidis]